LGHRNISKYRGHVSSVEDNYQFIGDNYKLKKRDVLILVGDIVFEPEALNFIRKLPAAKKVLVPGNHDWERYAPNMFDVAKTFDEIRGVMNYHGCWVTHVPIHQSEMRQKHGNIHGHIHDRATNVEISNNPLYFNVNVDVLWPETGEICINWSDIRDKLKRADNEKMQQLPLFCKDE